MVSVRGLILDKLPQKQAAPTCHVTDLRLPHVALQIGMRQEVASDHL